MNIISIQLQREGELRLKSIAKDKQGFPQKFALLLHPTDEDHAPWTCDADLYAAVDKRGFASVREFDGPLAITLKAQPEAPMPAAIFKATWQGD